MEDVDASSEAAQLDDEISALKKQALSLRKTLQIQCSTILSAASTSRLIRASSSPASGGGGGGGGSSHRRRASDPTSKLSARSTQQQAYMQQCVYRISAPITTFKVRDPDPNAVDGGHVLGLRFEIMSRGQFLRPYYVMLNRPFSASAGGSKHLRVHRHTVPPAVPLAGLAARHLPPPSYGGDDDNAPQDLDRFVRMLRREIVRYHNRLGVSADLRRRLGVRERASTTTSSLSPNAIVEVGIADIEAKQLNLTWADGRTGRLVMDDDGRVVKFVVFAGGTRDWEASHDFFAENDTIEDVARKLEERIRASAEQEE